MTYQVVSTETLLHLLYKSHSVNVSPESANNILINLGGVLQNPGTDYTIAASTITFTTAPAAGLSFLWINIRSWNKYSNRS